MVSSKIYIRGRKLYTRNRLSCATHFVLQFTIQLVHNVQQVFDVTFGEYIMVQHSLSEFPV